MDKYAVVKQKTIYGMLTALILAYISYSTLYPLNFAYPEQTNLLLQMYQGALNVHQYDVIQNLLFYLPYGISFYCFIYYGLKKCGFCSLAWVGLSAFAISFSLESLQIFIPSRHVSFLDVMLNMTSALIGALLVIFLNLFKINKYVSINIFKTYPHQEKLLIMSITIIIVWLAFELYPCIPTLETKALQYNIHYLQQNISNLPYFNVNSLLGYIGSFLCLNLLFWMHCRRIIRTVLLLGFLLSFLILKFIMRNQLLELELILAFGLFTLWMIMLEIISMISIRLPFEWGNKID